MTQAYFAGHVTPQIANLLSQQSNILQAFVLFSITFFSQKSNLPSTICFPAYFIWLLFQKFNVLLVHGNRLCSRESRP